MKQISALFLLCLLRLCALDGKPLSVDVAAQGAVLINAKNGAVLYEKNAHQTMYPASIAKVAVALYIMRSYGDRLDEVAVAKREAIASITPQAKRDSKYRAPPYWLETDSSHIGIKKGEQFVVRELLHALLIASANDAANVLAEHFGGTIPQFIENLNAFLKREVGCSKTHFLNPHGLHHPDQVTTPYEMALIAKEAMQEPLFRTIVSTVRYTLPATNLEYERQLTQTNMLLRSGSHRYTKAIGVKTGTTLSAGKNLIAAAEEGQRQLIAVVMACEKMGDRYNDAIRLFETAFHEQQMRRYLLTKGEQNLSTTIRGARGRLLTTLPDGLYYDFYPAEETTVKVSVRFTPPPLPIAALAPVGTVSIHDKRGTLLHETPLYAASPLSANLWYQTEHFLSENKRGRKLLFLTTAFSLSLFLWKIRRKKRR